MIFASSASKTLGIGLLAIAALAMGATAAAVEWPSFAGAPERLPRDVAQRIERVWRAPTLTRTIHGRAALVPLETYVVFIDAADVTTAAARFLGIGRQEVRALDDDVYEADDHAGATGRYRVLVREPRRRVILSWGEHRGRLFGTIRGSTLSVVDFERGKGRVEQRLTAYVLIENRIAARLLKLLAPIVGGLADRKLAESFNVVVGVAEWAVGHPDEFCRWMARAALAAARRDRVLDRLSMCR